MAIAVLSFQDPACSRGKVSGNDAYTRLSLLNKNACCERGSMIVDDEDRVQWL